EEKMCYSKFEFGKWSPKKILDGTMLAGNLAGKGCFNNLRAKLGADTPKRTINIVKKYPLIGNVIVGTYQVEDDYYNGGMVWSNSKFSDYAPVIMNKSKFYFWAEKNSTSGELT